MGIPKLRSDRISGIFVNVITLTFELHFRKENGRSRVVGVLKCSDVSGVVGSKKMLRKEDSVSRPVRSNTDASAGRCKSEIIGWVIQIKLVVKLGG